MPDTPETILNTLIKDLRITGQHPVPEWLNATFPDPESLISDHEMRWLALCVEVACEEESGTDVQ